MWLNVGMVAPKNFAGSFDSNAFYFVSKFLSAVIPFPGYPSEYLLVKQLPRASWHALEI